MSTQQFSETIGRLVQGVRSRQRRSIGRIISLLEDDVAAQPVITRALYPSTGRAYLIGLTGPPGAGKSTVVDELISIIRKDGFTVAVLAVDPNSPFSGGAILGDRVRMMRHSSDRDVYIRSMGARGHLGGLTRATEAAIMAVDAAGYDIVLLETVGVGQSELEIADIADTTILVVPPGLGDGIQAIKAGIMEIADIFDVNKADHPEVDRTVSDIRDLLRTDTVKRSWIPLITRTVATTGEGIEQLWERIVQHRAHLEISGEFEEQRKTRLSRMILDIAEDVLRKQVLQPRAESRDFRSLVEAVASRTMNPYEAADRILAADGIRLQESAS